MNTAFKLFLVAAVFASALLTDVNACRRHRVGRCCPCLVLDGQSEFVVFDGGADGKTFVYLKSYDSEIEALHRVWQLHAEGFQGMYIEYFYDRAADRLVTRKTIGPEVVDRYGRIVKITPRREDTNQPKTSRQQELPRVWRNVDGVRSALAVFVRVENNVAHFVREDGRMAKCQLSRLSLSDRQYIESRL